MILSKKIDRSIAMLRSISKNHGSFSTEEIQELHQIIDMLDELKSITNSSIRKSSTENLVLRLLRFFAVSKSLEFLKDVFEEDVI